VINRPILTCDLHFASAGWASELTVVHKEAKNEYLIAYIRNEKFAKMKKVVRYIMQT